MLNSLTEKNIKLQRKNEELSAENAKLRGIIEYLAIMCDVDIPEEEEAKNDTL